MTTYREELDLALHLAKEAGKVILPYFQTALKVETKSDNSPVTIADRKAEEALRGMMEKHTPGYGIIGEEFGANQAGKAARMGHRSHRRHQGVHPWGAPVRNPAGLAGRGPPGGGRARPPRPGPCAGRGRGIGCRLDGTPCRVSPPSPRWKSPCSWTAAPPPWNGWVTVTSLGRPPQARQAPPGLGRLLWAHAGGRRPRRGHGRSRRLHLGRGALRRHPPGGGRPLLCVLGNASFREGQHLSENESGDFKT